jgi:D-alanine-D-alanine ligase
MPQRVLILCGGRSAERDVSCVSAAAVVRHIPKGWVPVLVHIAANGEWQYQSAPQKFAQHPQPFKYRFERTSARLIIGAKPGLMIGQRRVKIDAVFPTLHGPMGEDGTLQGLLEFAGVPYVGAGVLASAVGMDKEVTKRLALQAGLPTLPYSVVRGAKDLAGARKLKFPVFVKPNRLGSSVGVYKVHKKSDLTRYIKKALRFDDVVLVEQGVEAREVEVAVLGDGGTAKASIPGEIRPAHEFYSYAAKYEDPAGAELLVPADLNRQRSREVQALARKAFAVLSGEGLARVDFLMDKRSGKFWFNELNTLPGFTAISMYPKLWQASGLSFPLLVASLLKLARARHQRKARLRSTR